MMQPRLITEVRDATGRVVREFEPEQYGQPISDESARELRAMMLSVTQGGTASSAFSGFPIPVAGKTGTATNGEDRPPNAWFTAFAPAAPGRHGADRRGGYRSRRRQPRQRGDRRPGGGADRAGGHRCVPVVRPSAGMNDEGSVTR